MSVADKYMMEVKNKEFNFEPPEFNTNLFRTINTRNDSELNLFPSETSKSQMYCYYNELKGCNNSKQDKEDECREIRFNIPTPTDILRKYAYDLEEDMQRSDVNMVYDDIVVRNKYIIDSLVEYNVPLPIAKLITKRIVKLALEYNEGGN